MDIKQKDIQKYAQKIIDLAHDTIMIKYRFFDTAMSKYEIVLEDDLDGYENTGSLLKIGTKRFLKDYLDEPDFAVRLLMHTIFHGLFLHFYKEKIERMDYWDIAIDIASENVILEMEFDGCNLSKDDEELVEIDVLRKKIPMITAEHIYKYFMNQRIDDEKVKFYRELFAIDRHSRLRDESAKEPEFIIGEEEWRKISRRVMTEVTRFNKKKTKSESFTANLSRSINKRISYEDILKRFSVWQEEIKINPDEFDYIYYTYGLSTYKNMPLIEPLEYGESKKIRDFVIAIDTSASCSNVQIREFLQKTYEILLQSESFFKKICLHIIAADNDVCWDEVINDAEDLVRLAANFKLSGRGATDFRPVFEYVDKLVKKKEIEDLKGLIYFTDGYGVYPQYVPRYGVIFAFLEEDNNRPKPPSWAIEAIVN